MSAISAVTALLDASGAHLMSLDNFDVVKTIARGTFGAVQLGRERISGKLYIIQIIAKRARAMSVAGGGCHVLETTTHPFLTALRYSFQTAERVCFLMEYANGGDLLYHLPVEGVFSESRTRFYLAEIVSALGYLHDEGIIYRDLQLENVLLDREGHVKITNFSLCKANMRYGSSTHTYCGASDYLAPEMLRGTRYGPAVDWWAVGVAASYMVCGRLPCAPPAAPAPTHEWPQQPVHFPSTVSVQCRALVAALLTAEPAARPSSSPDDALDVMHHNFFASIDWDDLFSRKEPPPFKPQVASETDTRFYDCRRVRESQELAHALRDLEAETTIE